MITPSDSPSSPEGFAGVTPHGQGPAPYDIQAAMPDLSGAYASAGAETGAGIVYPVSGRQRDTETLLSSPQGYGAFSISGGFSGGGSESWPADPAPGANAQTPDQGMGDYAGTGTD